jgi:hypothetical protein
MPTQIQVKLDTSANPPVTTIPTIQSVNRGNAQIQWTPFSNQSFTFVSLTGLPNPPFSNIQVSNAQITADDNNTAAGEYTYTITVSSGGNTYSTNATLVADPPGYGRTPPMPIGGGSNTPTIKNN